MSITVKTGYLTQVSASFMKIDTLQRARWLLAWNGGPFRLFLNHGSVVQVPGYCRGNAVPGFDALRDLKAASPLIFGLPGRANQPLGDPIPMEQKNLVHPVAII